MEHFYIANIESPCREYLDVGLGLPYNQSNIYTKLFVMFDTTFFQPQLRATWNEARLNGFFNMLTKWVKEVNVNGIT